MAHCIVKKYPLLQSEIVTVNKEDLPEDLHLNIPGEHNRENLALGTAVLRVLGCTEDEIKTSSESFKGVSGRLELIREKDGVKIYNDTTSTTPVATIAALEAVGDKNKKNIILIMGGADKRIDMTELLNILPDYCRAVVLLPGTGTDIVREKIKNDNPNVFEVENLQDAVSKALVVAKSDDVVLFSPGFASFGLFQNEFDRGEQFDALIKKL
jgi:UDP-N-acetylmuramoylalanine--D-glutamate ligase